MAHRWTDADRTAAIAGYVESGNLAEGQRAVALEDGTIPSKNTIRKWALAAGHNPDEIGEQAAAKTQAARVVAQRKWSDRRTDLLHELGEVAELALDHTAAYLHAGNPKLAKESATVCAIFCDKAQVLSGDASAIVRTPFDPDRVLAMAREDGERIKPRLEAV